MIGFIRVFVGILLLSPVAVLIGFSAYRVHVDPDCFLGMVIGMVAVILGFFGFALVKGIRIE